MVLPGQFGRGSIREMFVGETSSDIQRQLTDPDFHVANFPRDTVDKAPTTAPFGAVGRATTKSHQYEHFMCSADFPADAVEQRGSRPLLSPGAVHYFRAAFQPEVWELYTVKTAAAVVGEQVNFAVGAEARTVPYDAIAVEAGTSGIRTVPGRGHTLAVWTPATNTQPIMLVVKAISSLATDTLGAIDE